MRIAVTNRDRDAFPGGDTVQIDALIKAINKIEGFYTDWPLGFKPDFSSYDLVHAYHLNFEWCHIMYNTIWEQNKPYIITSIFYPVDNLGSNFEKIKEYVDKSIFTVVQSRWEGYELLDLTHCNPNKILVIPNGVSEEFISNSLDNRESVITVAIRDGDKNTEIVEKACKELNIPYKAIFDKPYRNMPDIYKSAKVFVNASGSERMSLTTHEALAANCRVISTRWNRGNEWFPELVLCDALNDYENLKEKIKEAYFSETWNYEPNEAARKLTWDETAKKYTGRIKKHFLHELS